MSTLNKKDKQLKDNFRSLSFVKDDDRTVVVLKIYQNEKNKEGLQFEKISPPEIKSPDNHYSHFEMIQRPNK